MLDFASLLFNIDISGRLPGAGSLLVAEPFLRESYFNHAVICLIDHAPGQASMGVVLNRLSGHTLQELLGDDAVNDTVEPVDVYCGGPMSCDRLFFLHTLGPDIIPGARRVAGELWIGGDFEAMKQYVNAGYPIEGHVRFFIGYSGWDDGQLDGELRKNVWAVTEFSSADNLLTGSEDRFWHRHVRAMGPRYRGWRYHPQNPRAN